MNTCERSGYCTQVASVAARHNWASVGPLRLGPCGMCCTRSGGQGAGLCPLAGAGAWASTCMPGSEGEGRALLSVLRRRGFLSHCSGTAFLPYTVFHGQHSTGNILLEASDAELKVSAGACCRPLGPASGTARAGAGILNCKAWATRPVS